jgi:hypothetical protein
VDHLGTVEKVAVTYMVILQLQVIYLQSTPEGRIVPDDTGKHS